VLPNIGFPTAKEGPDSIMVSKTDHAAMIDFVTGLKKWIVAAEGCLRGQR
jgi:hypothetical protein